MTNAYIKLLPKQTEAWNAWEDPEVTDVGYGGAAGGGKTRLGWYKIIETAERYPGSRQAVGRKELKTLRITTLAEFFIICQELGYIKDRDYSYNAQDNIIKFPNGSEVILLDMAASPQDPEFTRFGSLNLTSAWVEESNESPEKGITILKTRVGRHNKFTIDGEDIYVKAWWLETFNPNKGHVYRTYYKPWKEGSLPSHRIFIRALPGDNPHLPEQYILNLKRSDKTTRERLLNGNFDYDNDPLRLIRYDYIQDLFTNTIETGQKYLICDVARYGGDKIVFSLFNGLKLYGLFVYKYQGLDETTRRLKDTLSEYQIPFSHCMVDEDGVGGGVVDNARGVKGFMGNSKPFPIQDRPIQALINKAPIPSNFQNLRSQCFFKLADKVNAHEMAVEIEVFETNIEGYTVEMAKEEIVEELDQIKQSDTSGDSGKKLMVIPKSEMKEELGRSPDLVDTLMMRMYFEFKPENALELEHRRFSNHVERERNINATSR